MKTTIEQIVRDGWAVVDFDPRDPLIHLGREFGEPVPSHRGGPLVDTLVPRDKAGANPNSLSSRHGRGPFPYHTDDAKVPVPARYILLRLALEAMSDRPTLLHDIRGLDLSEDDLAELRQELWLVSGGRGKFYTPLLNATLQPGHEVLRYDVGCMRPVQGEVGQAGDTLAKATARRKPAVIDWSSGFVVIIDNWRMLHGRGEYSGVGPEERVLERLLIRSEN